MVGAAPISGLASAPAPSASRAALAGDGVVEGVVTGLPNGLALQNVSVILRSATHSWVEVRTTDDQGAFRFSELPAGVYSLEAHGAGFFDAPTVPLVVLGGVPITEHLQMSALPPPRLLVPRT
jgi:hypothetical protein